jgi:ADP-ribose pyrophosphatase YjhB (NUDIX family)
MGARRPYPDAVLDRLRRRGFRALRVVPAPVMDRLARVAMPSYMLGTVCRIEHDGNVLLVQPTYRKAWGMPGGLVGRGEDPRDGVRREVREEVGVDVTLVGEPIVVVDSEHRLVDFLFRGELADGVDPGDVRAASSEIDEVAWTPIERAAQMVGGPAWMAEKLELFDRMADGGLVVLDGGRKRSGHA